MNGAPHDPVGLASLADQLLDQGRIGEARAVLLRALPEHNDDAAFHCQLGRVHRAAARLDLALESFRKALSLDPGLARAALGLGQTCYDLGRSADALPYLERAVHAEPDNAEALCACGQALADAGHVSLALEFLRRAIEAAPGRLRYTLAAIDVLQDLEFSAEQPWFEQFLADCLDNPILVHDAITNVATSLLWTKPAVQDALAADRLDSSHFATLAAEPLLLRLLRKTIVRSWPFEAFVTRLRESLTRLRDPDHLALLAAIAEQAFNAGYVEYQSEEEAALEQALLGKGVASLTPVELMALASYRPLIDVPGAPDIEDWSDFPGPTQPVIRRTLKEPLREKEIRSRIVALTPIENAVSLCVQAQYEEHPYPRWSNIEPVGERNESLGAELARNVLGFDGAGWPARPKVLVPGCGTGYHPLSLARRHPEADVLAVDLSLASLAYAIRKQETLALTNVRFRQADLLGLRGLEERFDYIDCAGVLHHLEWPMEGWRVLADLLEPGGVMRIGLYSELARKTIVAAREKIAAMGIPGTPPSIRAFRRAIMSDPALSDLRSLARTTADFFSMGGVRDLLFHVQEHRFDLPTVERHLGALGLRFGGFILSDRDTVRDFHARYPALAEWLDLGCWAAYEAERPGTFYRMYQFYCLKPGSRA